MATRREIDKETRRNQILEKAQNLFARKGYLSTSMAEIADSCEIAVGSLYSFFTSKEEILSTIFNYHIENLLQLIDQIAKRQDLSPRQKIESSLEELVRIYTDNQDFFRIYVAEARGVEWGVRSEVGEYIYIGSERYLKILTGLFREAIATGAIDPDLDPEYLSLLLRSFVHSTVSHLLYGNRNVTMEDLLTVAKRILFGGIELKDNNKKI